MNEQLRATIERIKEVVPLTRVLGLPDGYTGAVTCPHPGHSDRSPSAHIYGADRGYCFGAGHPGKQSFDVIDVICRRENCGFLEAVKTAAEMAGVDSGEIEGLTGDWGDEGDQQAGALHRLDRVAVEVWHQIMCQSVGIEPAPPSSLYGNSLGKYGVYDLDDDEVKEARAAFNYCTNERGWDIDTVRGCGIGYCPWDPTHLWSVLDMFANNFPEDYSAMDYGAPPCSGLFLEDSMVPWFGGRLTLPFGMHSYAVGRTIPGVPAHFLQDRKYIKPLHHSEKRPHIWECRTQPLLISPPKMNEEGRVVVPSPLDADEILIVAEGIPDAISAWQTGYPVVSAVTTTTAKGRQSEELLAIAQEVTRNGGEVVFVPDLEENRAGEVGAIKTAIHLVKAGVEVKVAMLRNGDMFEYEPGRGAA